MAALASHHSAHWRQGLALLRLVLLYAFACMLLVSAGLLWRTHREADPPPGPPVRTTGLPFAGVTVELQGMAQPQQMAYLHSLRDAGFGWVRQRFDWSQIEPQPGQYDWEAADAAIAAAQAAGLPLVAVLDGSPAWARAAQDVTPIDNPLAPPQDPATFARFAAAFAERYAGRIRYYQVWDEPNVAPHWGARLIEPVAYAQLLKPAAAAIRARDPAAVIVAAALAPTTDRGHNAIDEAYFLQRLKAAGAGAAIDVVALQPFGFGHSPAFARSTADVLDFRRAAYIRRVLEAMGWGDKPVWAVRMGWNRTPNALWGAVTPAAQAGYAVAAYAQAWTHWPWLEAMGWAVDRPAAAAGDPRWGFSLHTPDGSAAPVLSALAAWLQPAGVRPHRPGVSTGQVGDAWLPWLGLTLIVGIAGWRAWAAARLLPWQATGAWWRGRPWPVRATAWAALLIVYYFATWPPLIGLCWIGWALLALAQPTTGLALAAALLPFFFQHKELALVDVTLAVPPATAALVYLIPAVAVRLRRGFAWEAADWTVLALLLLTLPAGLGVWNWGAYAAGFVALVLAPVGLWLAVRVLGQDAVTTGRTVAAALALGGVAAAAWGLTLWLGGRGIDVDGVRRLVGPHFSPNHTALYLVRTLFVVLGLVLAGRRWRAVWSAAAVMVVAALVLTGSRGALLLGLPVGLVCFVGMGLLTRPHWRKAAHHNRRRLLLIGAVALVLGAGLAVTVLGDRLINLRTAGLRLDLWEAALRLWRDHPWVGVGPGGFFWGYPAYLLPGASVEPNQFHPHNVWLELTTTWGVVGLAWAAVLLWVVVRRVGWPRGWIAIGLAAGLAAGLAHGQVDAFFGLADIVGWNAVALALLVNGEPAPR